MPITIAPAKQDSLLKSVLQVAKEINPTAWSATIPKPYYMLMREELLPSPTREAIGKISAVFKGIESVEELQCCFKMFYDNLEPSLHPILLHSFYRSRYYGMRQIAFMTAFKAMGGERFGGPPIYFDADGNVTEAAGKTFEIAAAAWGDTDALLDAGSTDGHNIGASPWSIALASEVWKDDSRVVKAFPGSVLDAENMETVLIAWDNDFVRFAKATKAASAGIDPPVRTNRRISAALQTHLKNGSTKITLKALCMAGWSKERVDLANTTWVDGKMYASSSDLSAVAKKFKLHIDFVKVIDDFSNAKKTDEWIFGAIDTYLEQRQINATNTIMAAAEI